MKYRTTSIPGMWIIEPEPHRDARGYFARLFCREEFAARGLVTDWPQVSTAFNQQRGTLRGLHYQVAPHEEVKLVRCTRGAVFDATVDLRPGSPTFGQWFSVELSETTGLMLYVPVGIAHGLQSLTDQSEVLYLISTPHAPASTGGVRWNDPRLAIPWPLPDPILSDRDRQLPDFPWGLRP